ncbi:MAG: magnesium transporter [Peptoniphilus sp.]|uniref:magnesium transporter n=1 Tax=Peptoniphilus sp. TaxID=1971214 RepID=UPI002A748B44|nr:magnesium transporter [Peptoniphilus sp.]MDY2986049.1 magnesium transporter [Peptoniphilus sp.]
MNREKYDIDEIKELQKSINLMDPVDLAEIFEILSPYEIAIRIKLLNKDLLADTFALLSSSKKVDIIKTLSRENIMELIKELDEDELVDTLQELPANMVGKLMNHFIEEGRRPIINELLGYPDESVGSIMSVNFMSAKISRSIKDILNKVVTSDLDANKLEQIWITDNSLKLKGFVYLADLLRNVEKNVEFILHPINKTVSAYDDQEIVAKLAFRYDLSEIPVVDSENRLIGTVPAEWAIDVMVDEYNEDISNIHGITDIDDDSYMEVSNLKIAKNRITWLIICLITATMTGFIIKRYESTLATSVVLAAYIPMLMDSGGNAGSQASTTVIRALYIGEVDYHTILKVMLKELKIGFYVGIALVFINILRIFFMDSVSTQVMLTVSITLLITVMISKVIGGMLPLIADKFKIDPTVMAGPIITTIVDTVALLIYFEVASKLINL